MKILPINFEIELTLEEIGNYFDTNSVSFNFEEEYFLINNEPYNLEKVITRVLENKEEMYFVKYTVNKELYLCEYVQDVDNIIYTFYCETRKKENKVMEI